MKKIFPAIVLFTFLAANAYAWDALGHRIVAELAYNQLTKKARKQVDNILGTRGIIYYAAWADEIKSDTIYPQTHAMHYQNLRAGMTAEDIEYLWLNNKAEGEHAFYAIDSLVNLLQNDKTDKDALKFAVHIMADLFQPMHLGHPEDLGGNRVQMRWFGQGINLHSLWDRWLIDNTQMSQTEYVRYLEDKFSDKKKDIERLTMIECLLLTYERQNAIYEYQNLNDKSEYHYAYRFRSDLDISIYSASVKLAQLLNEIYR